MRHDAVERRDDALEQVRRWTLSAAGLSAAAVAVVAAAIANAGTPAHSARASVPPGPASTRVPDPAQSVDPGPAPAPIDQAPVAVSGGS